jgi:hypothetical protein
MEPVYFRCRNWHKFQHYQAGGRRLAWIKNYLDLDDPSSPFRELSFADQGKLQAIWRLAAKLDNRIPFDEMYVGRVIGARVVPFGLLLDAGWIQTGNPAELKKFAASEKRAANRKKGASKPIAKRKPDSSLEAEQEVRSKKEEINSAVLVLGLDIEKIAEVDRIIDSVRGASQESIAKLSPLVGALPLGVAIGIRERAVGGGKGIGWVVNALQGELNERRAAA